LAIGTNYNAPAALDLSIQLCTIAFPQFRCAGPENLAAQGGGWKAGRRLIPIEKTLIAADARE